MPKTAINPSQEKHISGQQGGELGYTVVLEVFSPLGNKVCMLYQLTCLGSPLGEETSSVGPGTVMAQIPGSLQKRTEVLA